MQEDTELCDPGIPGVAGSSRMPRWFTMPCVLPVLLAPLVFAWALAQPPRCPTLPPGPAIVLTCRASVHPTLPLIDLRIEGALDPSLGLVAVERIVVLLEGVPLQTLDDLDTGTLFRPEFQGFVLEDLDFDGDRDLRLMALLPAGPNVPYLYWLFDFETRRFIRNEALEIIVNPEVDLERRWIASRWRDSAAQSGVGYYRLIDGVPVLMRQEIERFEPDGRRVTIVRERQGSALVEIERTVELPRE
jgi:hypothetical protein